MENLVSYLFSAVLIYKYWAIFIITFLGAFFLPLPTGTVVMASTAFSVQGYLSFPAIFFFALLGNVLGDQCGYWVTRLWGVKALHWLGMKKVVASEKYQKTHALLSNHPMIIIFLSRFMTGVNPLVNLIAGLTRLEYRRFFIFEFIGELAYAGFFSFAGLIFGANWEYLNDFSWEFWAILLSCALLLHLIGKNWVKKRRKNKSFQIA